MGFFSGIGSSRKGKAHTHTHVLLHQAEWHWHHRVPLPYPDVTLPHDWHLDPERIPVPAAPRTARAHAEEVRRRRALLTSE